MLVRSCGPHRLFFVGMFTLGNANGRRNFATWWLFESALVNLNFVMSVCVGGPTLQPSSWKYCLILRRSQLLWFLPRWQITYSLFSIYKSSRRSLTSTSKSSTTSAAAATCVIRLSMFQRGMSLFLLLLANSVLASARYILRAELPSDSIDKGDVVLLVHQALQLALWRDPPCESSSLPCQCCVEVDA